MTIKTVSRRNWPDGADRADYATWYEPFADAERIRAAVSWVLAHEEVTGLATAGRRAPAAMHPRGRARPGTARAEAEAAARGRRPYSSPFLDMPI